MSLFETAKARVLSENRDPSKSIGRCYGYVKDAICSYYGIERSKITGGSAIDAMQTLPKLGWVNMIDQYPTQLDAPADSILVYSGGKHGHIEIASDSFVKKEFVSDFLHSFDMVNGKSGKRIGRKLVGVFCKE